MIIFYLSQNVDAGEISIRCCDVLCICCMGLVDQKYIDKMLSYRRETVLQGAL